MFLSENITPNTSFASSSKGRADDVAAAVDNDGMDCPRAGDGLSCGSTSFTATTMPDADDRVLRGLLYPDPGSINAPDKAAADAEDIIARETAGSRP